MSNSNLLNQDIYLDPKIWGKHFWFVLHTIAITYPNNPNETMKKKVYDFIQNLPIFLPNEKIGNIFMEYLDKYPVSPYLDNRQSFMKWMHFIHNKINIRIGKKNIDFIDSLEKYYNNYKVIENSNKIYIRNKQYIIIGAISLSLLIASFYLYNR